MGLTETLLFHGSGNSVVEHYQGNLQTCLISGSFLSFAVYATMFATLKSKIKEETGSDLSRLTSSWRSGAFLGRIALRDDSVS